MRPVILVLLFIAGGVLLIFLVQPNASAVEPTTQTAIVDTASPDFNEMGTLIFYTNNVGPVPYIFYQDPKGHTVAKALAFANTPPDLSSWVGAHVSVVGHLKDEYVETVRITYISPP